LRKKFALSVGETPTLFENVARCFIFPACIRDSIMRLCQ
jgi:hypothetical protein